MKRTHLFALCGATFAVVLAPTVALAASGPKVTVRVEGRTRTLLAASVVQTQTGFVSRNGAPRGACSATSAAGALDLATRHRWVGQYKSTYADYLVESILGESQTGSAYYWGIWIDDRYASAGICGTKLRSGDQLLFAVDSVAHHEHPIELVTSRNARAGRSFSAKVIWFSDAGVAKPLAGARILGAGVNVVTNGHGTAKITASRSGTLVLRAARAQYIRAESVRVRVSG
jgi:hypothetical protein